MVDIQQLRKDRFKFLHLLYEKTEGSATKFLREREIGEELGFDKDLTYRIAEYLKGEMLLDYPEFGSVNITHEGVIEVETALQNPEESTNYFPAVNIINIQNMENSLIQQGTHSSKQSANISISSIPQINDFLDQLKKELPNVSIEPDDKEEIESDIQTIELQLKTKRPKSEIIKTCFGSIQRILEGTGGSLIAHQLLQSLPSIMNLL